jgi:hypothetical protein
MPQPIPALTLLAAQTRMINATEGFRLEVQSGCLWLTRPGDSVDRFLVAGSSIELHENGVLIQSDRHPGATGLAAARYRLTPIQAPAAAKRAVDALPLTVQPLLRRQKAPVWMGPFTPGWFSANFFTKKQRLT